MLGRQNGRQCEIATTFEVPFMTGPDGALDVNVFQKREKLCEDLLMRDD